MTPKRTVATMATRTITLPDSFLPRGLAVRTWPSRALFRLLPFRSGGWGRRLALLPVELSRIHERFREHGSRGHLPRIERLHEPGRHHHQQLGIIARLGAALEQVPDNRDVAEHRDLVGDVRQAVVEEPGDREALPVARLQFGL